MQIDTYTYIILILYYTYTWLYMQIDTHECIQVRSLGSMIHQPDNIDADDQPVCETKKKRLWNWHDDQGLQTNLMI